MGCEGSECVTRGMTVTYRVRERERERYGWMEGGKERKRDREREGKRDSFFGIAHDCSEVW